MQYTTHIQWQRQTESFDVKSFDRTHKLQFGGGLSIDASSAPEFVGKKELPNPEELFTASIASCFMLTFLYWAAMRGFVVNDYRAEAVGTLGKNPEGKMAMTEVLIKPSVTFEEGKKPDSAALEDLYKKAHDNCFISCSVKTKVTIGESAAVS